MGIALRHGRVGVAKNLLHLVQGTATVDKIGGILVPEVVQP